MTTSSGETVSREVSMVLELQDSTFISVLSASLAIFWALELRKFWRTWTLQRRFRLAEELENLAGSLLEEHGWTVLGAQVEAVGRVVVDNRIEQYKVRVDYLVQNEKGQLYVAEVKSGTSVTKITHRETRRQLLEYAYIFQDAEGLLLIDMNNRTMKLVRFPLFQRTNSVFGNAETQPNQKARC